MNVPIGEQVQGDYVLFSGSSHPVLAQEIAGALHLNLGKVLLQKFPDGEIECEILESVRGRDVFVIQSVALDPNQYLVELLIMMDALKRASARSIVAVVPYYGYSRQDRRLKPRVPITAKLVANTMVTAGATRVLTMDLHAGQLEGFFDVPVDNLCARKVLISALAPYKLENCVVVAPDLGSIKRARSFAKDLGCDFAVIDKRRSSATRVEAITLIGDVSGKDVLLADDMCSTGSTLATAAKACHEKGARRILAVVTHGIFVGNSVEEIEQSPIEALLVSNTVPYTQRLNGSTKIQFVSVGSLLSQAIRCMISAESISFLT